MKQEKELGCVGGLVVIAIAAAIWWNDWTAGIRPGREAYKAMREFHRGVPWPDAVVAAEATLPAGRQFSGHCRLADGQLAYFGRWKTWYMTQLPEIVREFRTRDLWRVGLHEQLVQPRLCRSLVISVNRDYDFDVALDDRDAVVKVKEIEGQ